MSNSIFIEPAYLGDLAEDMTLGSNIPPWLIGCLPPETVVAKVSIPFGTLIADHSGLTPTGLKNYKDWLGVILSGEAEIFDRSTIRSGSDRVTAHRPIRLLVAGDTFGDFELLDRAVSPYARRTPSREYFQLIAGRRCFLLQQQVPNRDRRKFYPRSEERSSGMEFEVFNLLHKRVNSATTVGLIDMTTALGGREPPLELWKQSWLKAKAYRDGVNSFNFGTLLNFKSRFFQKAEEMKADYSKLPPAYKTLPQIFADALFDAMNRPTLGDPMYRPLKDELGGGYLRAAFDLAKVRPDKVLVTSTEQTGPFWYPLDLHNYLINLYLAALDKEPNKLPTELLSAFAKQQASSSKNGAAAPGFYRDLINAGVELYEEMTKDYPFDVECLTLVGATRPMLMLEFRNKAKPS